MLGEVAIFGASGMLGSAVSNRLDETHHVLEPTHEEYDLTSSDSCDYFFDWNAPDTVIMCAGKVGGIKANMEDPLNFLNENLMMTMNVINSCVKNEYYRKQQGLNYISIIPCNLYGPNDNWTESGHVMTALIRNINEAAGESKTKLTIRGSGKAKREFLHTGDAAYGITYIMDIMHKEPDRLKNWNYINLGSGVDYSIKRIAAKICDSIGFSPEFEYDRTFPNGMPRKVLNIDRISSLGWKPQIDIDDGILEMIGYAS